MLRPRHAVIAGAIVVLLVAIEYAVGRPPICRCGVVRLWTGTVNGPENSQQLLDWYSLSHVVHGLLAYALLWAVACRLPVGWRLVVATAIEAGWELLENSPIVIERYRAATLAFGYSGDSILNSASDVVCMMIGFLIAWRLPPRLSVAFALTLELAALVAIRDNLTLNVLMLVHPSDAVRRWQAG